jgi:mannosyl-3-phosphoglycerate phosphatase
MAMTTWPASNAFLSRFRTWRDQANSRCRIERIVLFTDPDTLKLATSPAAARTNGNLSALEDEGIAVVLCGNETRSELELIQSDWGLLHPFISENGGGLFIRHGYFRDQPRVGRDAPTYHVVDFGKPYHVVADALRQVAGTLALDIVGFSGLSIQDVARRLGLSLSRARLAKLREYDEPFHLADADPATFSRLCHALRRVGVRCFSHDGFHHATGVADRAQSIQMLTSLYRQASGGGLLTVGLAREPSETCLLRAVDIPIVVHDAVDAGRLGRKVPTAHFVSARASRGWRDAILQLVERRSQLQAYGR